MHDFPLCFVMFEVRPAWSQARVLCLAFRMHCS